MKKMCDTPTNLRLAQRECSDIEAAAFASHDLETKARLLYDAVVLAGRMIPMSTCFRRRLLARAYWFRLWTAQQLVLRLWWRESGIGFGLTIGLWAWLNRMARGAVIWLVGR